MASRSFSYFVEHEVGKVPHFLIYAVLEWVMIIVLFIDGFLAFISNEFAKFFELKPVNCLSTRTLHNNGSPTNRTTRVRTEPRRHRFKVSAFGCGISGGSTGA